MSEIPTMFPASTDVPTFVAGKTLSKSFHACPNREAALLSLCHSKPADVNHLLALTPGEWRKLLRWLDVSGLSLYLAHQIDELNLQQALPDVIKQRLRQNLADNRVRMQNLLQESAKIQAEFQRANICYAVVDGFSFCQPSMLRPEVRHQLDLDYLVDEGCASCAREILERAGYQFHGVHESAWKFAQNEAPKPSTKNMYKDGFARSVKLHIEAVAPGREPLWNRREYREIEGITMPVLAPADQFLRQGMDVFNNVCSSFLRASHLLEFYRHLCAHGDDPTFWSEVLIRAEGDAKTVFGLGVVLNLIESVMEGEIPGKLVTWTMLRIPDPAQRWVSLYGPNCVYGTPPGTKLYLLLLREMQRAGISSTPPARGEMSIRSPRVAIPTRTHETMAVPLQRSSVQFCFVVQGARFHLVEGVRYAWASYRWRRFRGELLA